MNLPLLLTSPNSLTRRGVNLVNLMARRLLLHSQLLSWRTNLILKLTARSTLSSRRSSTKSTLNAGRARPRRLIVWMGSPQNSTTLPWRSIFFDLMFLVLFVWRHAVCELFTYVHLCNRGCSFERLQVPAGYAASAESMWANPPSPLPIVNVCVRLETCALDFTHVLDAAC